MDATNTNNEESRVPVMANNTIMRNTETAPPIFPSVPALNEAATYISETTSYLTSCFPANSGLQLPNNDGLPIGADVRERMVLASEAFREPLLIDNNNVGGYIGGPPTVSGSIIAATTNAPLIREEITRISEEDDRAHNNNNNNNNNNNTSIVPLSQTRPPGISMFQGLVDRVKKTMHGSSDDIGWLQRAPDMPPVEDGTERFNHILENIRHGIHVLPNSMIYLLVPGLFSNHGPLYFTATKASFSKMGLTCHIAKIHSEASVEKNARELKEYIEEIYWGSKKRVLLLGHSKGGVDSAAALSIYWPELRDKVAGLALAQSPYGGSPIASDIMREGQLGDYFNVRKLMEILICKVIKGDLQSLEDLTYEKRREFLKRHHMPKELPVVSFHTEAKISPTVLATLSRVAQAELPTFAPLSATQTATVLPVVVPLGATLAACAQLLTSRYGEKSDGLVTCRDAEVPGSVVVRPTRKLDHAWMVYSSTNDDPLEPDASQVCEALLTLVMEVGLRKKHFLSVKEE